MKYLHNMKKNRKKVVICPWGYVSKTMFARKSTDVAIPNLFLKTGQKATLYKEKKIDSLRAFFFQTLI